MKSTGQSRKERSFPLTNYNYQPSGDAKSSCANVYPAKKSPGLHELSSQFFGVEESRHYLAEFSAFTVLGLITAWLIFSSIVAVLGMARY
jgi:hypothetical protein